MRTLNARQIATGRRQLEIEAELIAQGVDPSTAAQEAARSVMSAGNGAELDNLEGAAAPLGVEPLPAEERALAQEQGLAAEMTAGYRSGQRNFQAEGDYQYAQEQGLGGFEQGAGKTDLDLRRRLQDQQGFIRTQQGMVPVGPQITPERVQALGDFMEFANETPGTARQAQYDPESYEQYREGVRNDIRQGAQNEMAAYGTGSDEQLRTAALSGNDAEVLYKTSATQLARRAERAASEDRVRVAQRGRPDFYEERLRANAGLPRAGFADPAAPTVEELESAAYRQRYDTRQADLASRKQALIRTRQAQTNPLEYMNRDDIGGFNQMVAADAMLRRGYRGATPLDVEGAHNKQLTDLGLRVAQGQSFQQQTPEQRDLIQLQIEKTRRELQTPQERAAADVAAGRGPFSGSITDRANAIVDKLYSRTVAGLPTTEFSVEEVELAAVRLSDETGLPLEEARKVMARVREDRHGADGPSQYETWF
jgi:hypothetical protein